MPMTLELYDFFPLRNAKFHAIMVRNGTIWECPLPGYRILPFVVTLLCFLPFVSKRKTWGRMRECGCLGTHLSLPSVPQSHQLGLDETRQSPAEHGQQTHQGLDGEMPNALIKLMPIVDFLCMDASIAACQRVVSHASRVESYGHLQQGCSRWGVSCPESTWPPAWRYGDKKTTKTQDRQGSALPQGSDISERLLYTANNTHFLPEIDFMNRNKSDSEKLMGHWTEMNTSVESLSI